MLQNTGKNYFFVGRIMWKVNLVLADIDERYIDSLSKFIRGSFTNKFNANVFTQKDALIKFLESAAGKIDILMLSPGLFCEEIDKLKPKTTIFLSDSSGPQEFNGIACINKFQAGDTIMGAILEIYSSLNVNAGSIVKGSKTTSLISVFSPVGGSGKTTISMALSVMLASEGMKTLYLNLETTNSMPFFIKNLNTGKGMSNLLFYLKESKKNLSIKIDTLKSFDNILGISYFNPVDCCLEMDELTEFDIGTLLFELKEIKQFDVLVVDLDSAVNRRNMAVLNNSGVVVMPVLQDELSLFKIRLFEKELEKIYQDQENTLNHKIIPVINRFQPDLNFQALNFFGQEACIKIPVEINRNRHFLDGQGLKIESGFMKCIGELSKSVLVHEV
jgi:cellulose biosynthesis protein BcsQ